MKDKKVEQIIKNEDARINAQIPLIASENIVSQDVISAQASSLINKYAEGSVGKRYYAGNKNFDEIEALAQSRALNLFVPKKYQSNWEVNVQPLSGSPANLAIYSALLKPNDKILAMKLDSGGHLSHGHKMSLAGQLYNICYYEVNKYSDKINYREVEEIAKKEKPKLIIAGASAYPREIDFERFGQIAKSVGAKLLADISHIAGLIVAGEHQNAIPFADVVMTTTHKTLRGPRGAIILAKKDIAQVINKAVFPGIQGGPHGNQIAAKAVAFYEAAKPAFKKYIKQVKKNAEVMAFEFSTAGYIVISGGTDTHLVLIDVSHKKLNGKEVQEKLEGVGIIINANLIPYDTNSPMNPSGIRLGTAAITTLGADEHWTRELAQLMIQFLANEVTDKETAKQVTKLRARLDKV